MLLAISNFATSRSESECSSSSDTNSNYYFIKFNCDIQSSSLILRITMGLDHYLIFIRLVISCVYTFYIIL